MSTDQHDLDTSVTLDATSANPGLNDSVASATKAEPLFPMTLQPDCTSNAIASIAASMDAQPSTVAFTFVQACFVKFGSMGESEARLYGVIASFIEKYSRIVGRDCRQGVDEESTSTAFCR